MHRNKSSEVRSLPFRSLRTASGEPSIILILPAAPIDSLRASAAATLTFDSDGFEFTAIAPRILPSLFVI